MQENFDHKEIEKNVVERWQKNDIFTPKIEKGKKPFSMFLNPPNASGPMHVGNALMVALQDILARWHRANGEPTIWIPGTDHGGYETQVSFERELESSGDDKSHYTNRELFLKIKEFVDNNNQIIKNQLKGLGASVDWSRFRFTMDEQSLVSVNQAFKKMVADGLIYRDRYMVNYCPSCTTFLAEIELKEAQEKTPLYFVKFALQNSNENLVLATTRPEFLFSITHVLVHPTDNRYSKYIGKTLLNPITGQPVEVIASKRKFDPQNAQPFLSPFCPSFKSYDYQYALRSPIPLPSRNLLDWQGKLIERHPGLTASEARIKEIAFLEQQNYIEKIDEAHFETVLLCKKNHPTENLIVLTWFLKVDDPKHSLRQPALEAVSKKDFMIFPNWRKKGLAEWLTKMHDWPIARQNVWGIKIPIWYDISEPEYFMVWFTDKKGGHFHGNLKDFLEQGVSLSEILNGLDRVYADQGAKWTLEKQPGKSYLPETDTFDTWFSSGQWASIAFGDVDSQDFAYFYPSDAIFAGTDLLRLFVSREIFLSLYLTNKLPCRYFYLNQIIKGKDGQKMSKSLGNAVSLDHYLKTFGADATRMALVSYMKTQEDFIFSDERLQSFQNFSHRLWQLGQIINVINGYNLKPPAKTTLQEKDKKILLQIDQLSSATGFAIQKYLFTSAQEKVCDFLTILEEYAKLLQEGGNLKTSAYLLQQVYEKYLILLHPFMPFMTEELYENLHKDSLLATVSWPK